MTSPALDSWRTARPISVWLDNSQRPPVRPALERDTRTDLLVVGGGFTGLWTALLAKERDPDRDVLLIEGERVGWAASGRNGGFCAASLTHGESNGRERFGTEYETLHRLGLENLDQIEEALIRYGIDCGWERTGELDVATEPYQVDQLRAADGEFLDAEAVRREVDSPTYLAGSWNRRNTAILDPARLAWGLAKACETLGVRICETTRATALDRDGGDVVVTVEPAAGSVRVRAKRVALGTNVFPNLLRRVRPFIVPVYDYVLATEPLTVAQLKAIGWRNRQGIGDSANQFHYYRLTPENRILWGGYDAVYYFGGSVKPRYDQRSATFELLARQFAETFPQLAEVRFDYRWGGAIDTCTRFCAFYGTALGGQVSYVLGYTGLGVGSTRFGANVMLDLLAGQATERTELEMVRSRPLPFPPEPVKYAGIQMTRRSLAKADRNEGHRDVFLRTLDRLGLGFDS
ncbi:glycine/D-amino acid oxidase-like deaminating enzyme [Jatrophihabitans sp. GAS493]|uniref:NAD(P)/FAD-dependent oxidoreductase n=1 Tax=Jatrophihabitans sp. GAS493 TaxID=1907575 RepID=UPI000BB77FCA|nr:FAD-binding oxidoreductase [Jatrophihabitans sp. GAS493]SOD74580.1 glycine/D-amino acid oxidase-like deaminating enzyme [Jatrophihabitans sp. GAS493]